MSEKKNNDAHVGPVLSDENANGWDETAYLRASPKNAERLSKSIAQLNAGLGVKRDLIED